MSTPVRDRVATATSQDRGAPDRDRRADQWASDMHPIGLPVAADQRRTERPRWVHLGAAHRRGPQPGQRDVTTDPERADRADVLRCGRRPENHAQQGRVSAISIRNACQSLWVWLVWRDDVRPMR